MATALNRATASRMIGFLRQSFTPLRPLSASPAPQTPATADATADATELSTPKPKKKKKKNLFDVAQFLPNWGIGYKMAKTHWRDVSYELTKINLYKDGRHGKAWGIRHKCGVPAAEVAVKMSGVNKRGWKYVPQSNKKLKDANKIEEQASKKAEEQVAA